MSGETDLVLYGLVAAGWREVLRHGVEAGWSARGWGKWEEVESGARLIWVSRCGYIITPENHMRRP